MKIKIVLEWFLNPDHLPFLYGIEKGIFEENGFFVEVEAPNDHYDGFDDIKAGRAQIAITEPLHILEHYQDGLLSLGCFFETHGGILVKKEAMDKLKNGELLRIASPASNEFTNTLALELTKGYNKLNGWTQDVKIQIDHVDFYHIKNLKAGYDAAWLCFENFEGIEARLEGLDVELIGTNALSLPNVSALEMTTSKELFMAHRDDFLRFVEVLNGVMDELKKSSDAKDVYYKRSGEERSELMDAIINSTLTKFQHITLGKEKWHPLYSWFRSLRVSDMSEIDYDKMFEYKI